MPIRYRLLDIGGTVLAGSPADFGKLIADETDKWAPVPNRTDPAVSTHIS